jgi:hypothetical protein
MIVKYGAVVSSASGTLGGVTFSNRRGNPIASAKCRPCDRKTSAQVAHQLAMATAAKGWAALTAGYQFNWKLFAAKNVRQNRLGVSRQLSAYQFYLKENVLRAQVGAPLRLSPPPNGQRGIGSLDNLIFYTGGPYTLQMTPPSQDPTGYYAIYGARSSRSTCMGKKFPRLIAGIQVSGSLDVDLFTPWCAALGEMFSTEIYWLQIRYLGTFSLASAPASLTQMVF